MAEKRPEMSHAYAFISLAVFTSAIGLIIGRAVHQEIPPVGLSFWRWLLAALILSPFCLREIWQNIGVVKENLFYFLGKVFL